MSKKVEKYMSQYGERNYAPKNRKIEKSDLREYSNRSQCRQAAETSCSNSIQQSRQEQEEEEVINHPKEDKMKKEHMKKEHEKKESKAYEKKEERKEKKEKKK